MTVGNRKLGGNLHVIGLQVRTAHQANDKNYHLQQINNRKLHWKGVGGLLEERVQRSSDSTMSGSIKSNVEANKDIQTVSNLTNVRMTSYILRT